MEEIQKMTEDKDYFLSNPKLHQFIPNIQENILKEYFLTFDNYYVSLKTFTEHFLESANLNNFSYNLAIKIIEYLLDNPLYFTNFLEENLNHLSIISKILYNKQKEILLADFPMLSLEHFLIKQSQQKYE